MRRARNELLAALLLIIGCHGGATGSSGEITSPPTEDPEPTPIVMPAEVPSELDPELAAELVPIEPSPYYSAAPAPVFGTTYFQQWPLTAQPAAVSTALATGSVGHVQQAAVAANVPTTGPFTFEITSFSYDFIPIPSSYPGTSVYVPYASSLTVDGQNIGEVNSGEVQVSRSQPTVQVAFEVWGCLTLQGGHQSCSASAGGTSPHDFFERYTLSIDTNGDQEGCTTGSYGKGSICWRARGPASPPICFGWRAQFLDSGPWADFPSESFAVSRYIQSFPAAYARVDVTVTRSSGAESYHLNDALDGRGCIAAEKLPVLEQWQGDIGSLVLKVTSQFCYNASGGACAPPAGTTIASGVNVEVRSGPSSTGPETYCWAVTDDISKVPANCEQRSLASADLTHLYFVAARSPVAQVASVIGHILSREHETNGGLGVEEALARRRLSSRGGYPIIRTDTACKGTKTASCTDSTTLSLAPAPNSATDRKFLIAHEFGHFVQFNGQGMLTDIDALYNAPEVSTNPLCKCDHVLKDQQSHCLQSIEEPQIAQAEGFAQFFSALVWNEGIEAGNQKCTFVYYKPILDDHDLPGHIGASTPWNGYVLTPSAIAVSCSEPARWRDQHCLTDDPGKATLYGTEWDWMGFYWAITNDPDPARRWSVVDIFDAYRAAGQSPVSWDGGALNDKNYASLTGGAQTTKGASSPAMATFLLAGDTYGVSRK